MHCVFVIKHSKLVTALPAMSGSIVKRHSGREEYKHARAGEKAKLKKKLKKSVKPKVTVTDFYDGKKTLTKTQQVILSCPSS